jgi:hypothetical protein
MNGQLYERNYCVDFSRGEDNIGYLIQIGALSIAIAEDKVYPNFHQEVTNEKFIRNLEIPDQLYQELFILAQSRAKYEEKIKEAGTSLLALL